MYLKISSPDEIIFEGDVKKVVLPTVDGDIGILPGHIPLISIIKPGIVKILVENSDVKSFVKNASFLIEKNDILFTVSSGIVFLDGDKVLLTVSSSNSNIKLTKEDLTNMKINLEKEIEMLKSKGDIRGYEKIMIDLQKVTADLALLKMKGLIK